MNVCKNQHVKCALVSGGILHKPPRGTTAGGEVGWWDSCRRQVHKPAGGFTLAWGNRPIPSWGRTDSRPAGGPDANNLRLTGSHNFQQEIDKERNVKGDQEEGRNAEFISVAGENVCGFPIDIFGVLNQKILGNHPVISRRRN
jgi:hypothetical protein